MSNNFRPSASQLSGDTQSQRNRNFALPETDSELGHLDAGYLLERVIDLRTDVAYAKLENDLFERYLEKNDGEKRSGHAVGHHEADDQIERS